MTVQSLVTYLKDWIAKKSKHPVPASVRNKARVIKNLVQLRGVKKLRFEHFVEKICTDYLRQDEIGIQHAPPIPFKQISDLAKALWLDKTGSRKIIFNRRIASTALYFSHLGGLRWIDNFRISWQDLKYYKNNLGLFMFMRFRFTKANRGQSNQGTAFAQRTEYWTCPIAAISRWWHFRGKPARGLIFSDKKQRRPKIWEEKISDSTHRLVRLKSLQKGYKITPAKHSGRVTTAITLAALGLKTRDINRFLGWTQDSRMLNHYTNVHLAVSESGPAARLLPKDGNDPLDMQINFM